MRKPWMKATATRWNRDGTMTAETATDQRKADTAHARRSLVARYAAALGVTVEVAAGRVEEQERVTS